MKTFDSETVQKIRKTLEGELKPERFTHTLGVAYTATSMAMVFDADIDKALTIPTSPACAPARNSPRNSNATLSFR